MDNTATPFAEDATSHNGNGQSTLSKAKEQINPLIHQAQEKAGGMMDQAREQFVSRMTEQKGTVAEGLSSVSLALRQAGLSLQGQNQEKVGHYAEDAADQLERFGNYLQEQDVEQILDGVQDYARRNPTVILGATFALGFLAARFLKNAGAEIPSPNLPMRVTDTSPTTETNVSRTDSGDFTASNFDSAGTSPAYATGGTGSAGASDEDEDDAFSGTDLSVAAGEG